MTQIVSDTIAAIATPPGKGGIGIVRVSGPSTKNIVTAIIGYLPKSRTAEFCTFHAANGATLDEGIALLFEGPNSFTGEDILELQGHGGPVILDLILREVLRAGARLARPGEFSERAFLNDKLDLAQAESIADLIDASSEQAARAALHSLQGNFSKKITSLSDALINLRVYVEAAIDFPDEEIDFLSDGKILKQLEIILETLEHILANARQGSLLREGMTLVIAGAPNAGKSSLLNALSGRDVAIVTDIPGTTRDVLKNSISIDGMPLHIIDTAGLRESEDVVEQEGIRRAIQEIKNADRILLVIDSVTTPKIDKELITKAITFAPELVNKNKVSVILNKIDHSQLPVCSKKQDEIDIIQLSAKTGTGIDLLQEHLKNIMGFQSPTEGQFTARRRHLTALEEARDAVLRGKNNLLVAKAGELLAEELRIANLALGEITGKVSSDELLGKIFATFCIGK